MSKPGKSMKEEVKSLVKGMELNQCRKCVCKGNATACSEQDCTQHKTWYALHLQMKTEEETIARFKAERELRLAREELNAVKVELNKYMRAAGRLVEVADLTREIIRETKSNATNKPHVWDGKVCRDCKFMLKKHHGKSCVCGKQEKRPRVLADGKVCCHFQVKAV
jgi:hypothetical protein